MLPSEAKDFRTFLHSTALLHQTLLNGYSDRDSHFRLMPSHLLKRIFRRPLYSGLLPENPNRSIQLVHILKMLFLEPPECTMGINLLAPGSYLYGEEQDKNETWGFGKPANEDCSAVHRLRKRVICITVKDQKQTQANAFNHVRETIHANTVELLVILKETIWLSTNWF